MTDKQREEWPNNVVAMPARERPLTDEEIVRMRVMLRQFEQLLRECPVHRRVLFDED